MDTEEINKEVKNSSFRDNLIMLLVGALLSGGATFFFGINSLRNDINVLNTKYDAQIKLQEQKDKNQDDKNAYLEAEWKGFVQQYNRNQNYKGENPYSNE